MELQFSRYPNPCYKYAGGYLKSTSNSQIGNSFAHIFCFKAPLLLKEGYPKGGVVTP